MAGFPSRDDRLHSFKIRTRGQFGDKCITRSSGQFCCEQNGGGLRVSIACAIGGRGYLHRVVTRIGHFARWLVFLSKSLRRMPLLIAFCLAFGSSECVNVCVFSLLSLTGIRRRMVCACARECACVNV
mmetsp:Transcript_9782/g.28109  ORF Transcript_9782/g.28109 Transcript_9782/m.28109 type:complete len:128 (-) Transcript_9782:794-1177(-)